MGESLDFGGEMTCAWFALKFALKFDVGALGSENPLYFNRHRGLVFSKKIVFLCNY